MSTDVGACDASTSVTRNTNRSPAASCRTGLVTPTCEIRVVFAPNSRSASTSCPAFTGCAPKRVVVAVPKPDIAATSFGEVQFSPLVDIVGTGIANFCATSAASCASGNCFATQSVGNV